ncbi:MAG: NIPSNAP family protein [Thermoanaerobaculia bacterium]
MITLCIRYQIDHNKARDFEIYARALAEPIRRCGGNLIGYFLPTKLAGRTDQALALVEFSDLGTYEGYRDALAKDSGAVECLSRVESSACILSEDRSFMRQVS